MTETAAPNPSAAASWTDTIYSLNRGDVDAETDRLAYNHFEIWLPLTDNRLLPPHIQESLQARERPRIADVATGSGVWMKSLAELVPPRSELYGFDLDSLKFPSQPPPSQQQQQKQKQKPRMDFLVQDVLKPFPEELVGTFDLVHIRLLALGLRNEDWDVAVGNLVALLRPGGWIFWEDTADLFTRVYPPSRAYDEFSWACLSHGARVGRNPFMPSGLSQKFEKAGLRSCDQKIWNTWAADQAIQDNSTIAIYRLIRPSLASVVQDGGAETIKTTEDALRVEDEFQRDIKERGVRVGYDYFWVWGQRPL